MWLISSKESWKSCLRSSVEMFYQVPGLLLWPCCWWPSLWLLLSLPAWGFSLFQKNVVGFRPEVPQHSASLSPSLPPSPSSPKNEHPPGKRCQLEKKLMTYLDCSLVVVLGVLHGCCCVFSLASIDIFNSCFSCPFRGSLKTFVHTVHLLQKQTELGSLPVADVLYRFVVAFLFINFSSSSENVLSPCRE